MNMNMKTFVAASSLFCGISLCGCAAALSVFAATAKNTDRLAQKATEVSESDHKMLSELKTETISQYSFSYESDDKKVSIHADAPVILPDADQIPTLRIKCDGFTQEQATGMYDLLLKDYNPYYTHPTGEFLPADDQIRTTTETVNGYTYSSTGLDINSDNGLFYLTNSVSPNDYYPFLQYHKNTANTGMYYDNSPGTPVSEDEADALLSTSIRLSDAKEFAETFLTAAKVDATLQQISLIHLVDLEKRTPEEVYYEDGYSAIQLVYSPCIDAVPVGTTTAFSMDEDTCIWPLERISFVITDDGIIQIDWVSPTQVTETISDDTSLIPFEQASELFETMCPFVYAQKAASADQLRYNLNVTKVELCLLRVRDDDENRTGLLVPAWVFYGDEGTTNDGSLSNTPPYILFAVNAIDQTVIDLVHGY